MPKEEESRSLSSNSESKEILFKPPETISQSILEYLSKEIVEGRLEVGTRLVPEELSTRLSVSKSPVREALVCLERDGLVVSKPRIGFFVADIRIQDIEEIYPIRASLISLALRTIIENEFEPDFIQSLEEMLQEMEKRVQEDDIKGYFYLNVRLYNFLLDHCPNRRVSRMLDLLGKQVLRYRFLSMSQPGHMKRSLEGHKRLIETIKDKDIKAAAQVSQGIIYAALNVLKQITKIT